MQNPESYVAQGKDDTGAAIQLKPFDSSTIFKAYDYQPKKPLLDSLGKDITINTEGIRPEDRQLYVTPLTNAYIDEATNARIESNKAKTDIGGESFKNIANKKAEVVDMVSLLQKQQASVKDLESKVALDPFSFPSDWKEQVDEWYKLHPLRRGFGPNVQKLPDVDLNKFLGDLGTAERSGGSTTNRANGSSSSDTFTKFDPVIAKRNFDDLVVPVLNSGTPDANRVIASLEKDVRKLAELQKLDYTKLSDVDKMSLVLDVAEDQYMAAQKAKVHTRRTSSTSEADATKVEKIKAAGDASANQPFEPVAGYAYKTINKQNTNIIPSGSDQKGTTEIVDIVQIPIKGRLGGKNDNFAQINKEIKLKIPGTNDYATGTVEIISKYSDTNGKWHDEFWATIVDKEGVAKEVPLDAENMRTFKTEYRSDPEEILKKTKNDWKKVAANSELEDPEKSESWNSMDEDRRARFKNAYTRNTRKKKKAAENEVDPDEEFKRK
jgi:hypothetical protein